MAKEAFEKSTVGIRSSVSVTTAGSGTALVLNGLALAFLGFMLYARRDVAGALLFIIPTVLNLAAITALARARDT